MNWIPLLPLKTHIEVNEMMASLNLPSRVIGIAMNSRLLGDADAEAERRRVRDEFGVPVCDVVRHGPGELVEAILGLQAKLFPNTAAKAG
jgi:uncharacterized NAD-dependent epimerase/dehydratase family protein